MQAYSCGRLKWQYEEPAPGMEWFIDEGFGSYEQQARLLVPDLQRAAPVFVLAGARSDFTRLNPLLYRLQTAGIGSLTANLSGHSLASAPGAAAPSLVINLEEAWRFHSHIALECRTLIGHSLGAALALKNGSTVAACGHAYPCLPCDLSRQRPLTAIWPGIFGGHQKALRIFRLRQLPLS
ncbi:hypothetical protein ACEODG_35555 [Pseudomonas aeruginosa]